MSTGIGETLVAARRQQGVALSDAAAETRVRESYLAALEEEDFAALGGDVYVKGFLRNYARFLGLQPEPLLQQYRQHHEAAEEVTPAPRQRPLASPGADRPPWAGLIGVSALLLLGVILVVGLISGGDEPSATRRVAPAAVGENSEPAAAQQPARTEPTEQPAAAPAPTPPGATQPATEPAAGSSAVALDLSSGVELTFEVQEGESWVDVEVNGESVLTDIQQAGFSETFTGDEVNLLIGNAGATAVSVNGVDLGSLGETGDVVSVACATGQDSCDVELRKPASS